MQNQVESHDFLSKDMGIVSGQRRAERAKFHIKNTFRSNSYVDSHRWRSTSCLQKSIVCIQNTFAWVQYNNLEISLFSDLVTKLLCQVTDAISKRVPETNYEM